MPMTRAPVSSSEVSRPVKVGDSTTATSSEPSTARATRSRPWRAPEVTMISSGELANPAAAPRRASSWRSSGSPSALR